MWTDKEDWENQTREPSQVFATGKIRVSQIVSKVSQIESKVSQIESKVSQTESNVTLFFSLPESTGETGHQNPDSKSFLRLLFPSHGKTQMKSECLIVLPALAVRWQQYQPLAVAVKRRSLLLGLLLVQLLLSLALWTKRSLLLLVQLLLFLSLALWMRSSSDVACQGELLLLHCPLQSPCRALRQSSRMQDRAAPETLPSWPRPPPNSE